MPEGAGKLFGNGNGESRVGMAAYAKNDAQGEKIIHKFWSGGTACIFNIRMTDLYAAN